MYPENLFESDPVLSFKLSAIDITSHFSRHHVDQTIGKMQQTDVSREVLLEPQHFKTERARNVSRHFP
jgi:hypothetical protein